MSRRTNRSLRSGPGGWLGATVGLRKTGDGWKVTHEHTSVPFYMAGTDRPAFDLRPVTTRQHQLAGAVAARVNSELGQAAKDAP